MYKEKIEDKIQSTEKKLTEFSICLNRLNREYQELLDTLSLTPEQLKEQEINNDIDSSVREHLQNEKKKLDEKLNLELENVIDACKTKKTNNDRANIKQHWLFIR